MELARSPTIFIQKYLSFLLFTCARAYLKDISVQNHSFFSKKSQNIWSYQKKAVPLQSLLVIRNCELRILSYQKRYSANIWKDG